MIDIFEVEKDEFLKSPMYYLQKLDKMKCLLVKDWRNSFFISHSISSHTKYGSSNFIFRARR